MRVMLRAAEQPPCTRQILDGFRYTQEHKKAITKEDL